MSSVTKDVIYRFGPYQLRAAEQVLLRDGKRVELQQQTLSLLIYLIEHRDRAVGKDELLREVWGNPHLTDSAIARGIMKARSAVGDDGQSQAVIRTIQGQGVQFVARVAQEEPGPLPERRSRAGPAAALIAIALLALGWMLGSLMPGGTPAEALTGQTVYVARVENATGNDTYDWTSEGLPVVVGDLIADRLDGQVVLANDLDDLSGDPSEIVAFLGADTGLTMKLMSDPAGLAIEYRILRAHQESSSGRLVRPQMPQLLAALERQLLGELSGEQAREFALPARFDDPIVAELYARGRAAILREDHDQARELLEAALVLSPDDLELRFHLATAQGDPGAPAAIRAMQALIDDLPPDAPATLRARILEKMGTERWFLGEIEAAEANLDEARRLLDGLDQPYLNARVLHGLSLIHESLGRTNSSWELANLALQHFEDAGDQYQISMALTNLGYAADDGGRLAQAAEFHQRALAIREQFGFESLAAASRYGLARILRRQGQFEEAEALIEKAMPVFESLGLELSRFDALEELAEIRLRQGRLSDALELLDRAEEVARSAEDELGLAWSLEVRGRVRFWAGEIEPAIENLSESIAAQLAMMELKESALSVANLAAVLARSGNVNAGREELEGLAAIIAELPNDMTIAVRHAEALLAAAAGDPNAPGVFESALRPARDFGTVDREAEIAIDYALHQIRASELQKAESLLAVARRWRPDYFRLLRAEGQLLTAQGRFDRADELFARFSEEYPELVAQ